MLFIKKEKTAPTTHLHQHSQPTPPTPKTTTPERKAINKKNSGLDGKHWTQLQGTKRKRAPPIEEPSAKDPLYEERLPHEVSERQTRASKARRREVEPTPNVMFYQKMLHIKLS